MSKGFAKDQDVSVGQTLALKTPANRFVSLRVAGIVDDKSDILGDLITTNGVLESRFGITGDSAVVAGYAAGADADAIKLAIDRRMTADFPQVKALTAAEFKKENRDQISQLLGLIYGLLALSVIVSLFGIVNTLVLSITERTRELGMLRAIGTSRRQVKRMIRLEAVITALIGGILGVAIGVILAVLVTSTIDDFTLSIPGGTLLIVLIASGIAGVAASVMPARRAARLDVLEALAYE